jgi:hypothetical protein
VGSLPAAAGHRWGLVEFFISGKTLLLPKTGVVLFRSFMKSQVIVILVGLTNNSMEQSSFLKAHKSSVSQLIPRI